MKILFLDTSSFFVTVALINNDKVVYLYQDEIKNDMSSKIMPIISKGFECVDFKIRDIDKIIVANGPGSFTGVRIGVTIAKTMAWALKKEIITVSSLEVYASSNVDKEYVVPMIDARRGFVYTGVYDKKLNCIVENKYIDYATFIESLDFDYQVVSFDDIKSSIKPNIDLLKIINNCDKKKSVSPHLVNPNYLKKTEAEEKLVGSND